MRKIKYLFLTLLILPLLTGCDFIDRIFNRGEKIEINYIYKDKTVTKTYSDYSKVSFETCNTDLGYEFKGWSFEEDGTVITKNDLKGKTSVNLYPVISVIKYTITYELDGGTNDAGNPSFYTVEDELIISAPSKEDYAFIGWTTTNITEPVSTYTITKGTTGNLTLTANYIHGKLSVIFNYDGIDTQLVEYGEKCVKPEDPIKLGDHFECWCSDDALQNEFDFDTPITKSITLYPRWQNTHYYILTIDNVDLINSNYESGVNLPAGSTIILSTDYIVEGYEFKGWYLNNNFVSNDYKYTLKMPTSNTLITPMFNEIETYEYKIGSNSNLLTNIEKQTDGKLYGSNIGDNYGHIGTKLFISYYALDKLKPGLHAFVYESRLVFNVFVKVKEKAVTNIFVDYDKNMPYATLTFNEVEGYTYTYSVDSSEYATCYSGMVLDINKNNPHTIEIKCEDGNVTTYTVEAIPNTLNEYLTNTFKHQGESFDHYIDSEYDLKNLLEYYICGVYPNVGGTSYDFSFYYSLNSSNVATDCGDCIKSEVSVPYGLHYSISSNGKKVTITVSSSGAFNSVVSPQTRTDLTTTTFLPSYRSDDYNDFFIEKCTKTQNIISLYDLESLNYGIKPIFFDSTAEEVYNKAKGILRNYVDDYMTDFEKLKAIYDYIATYVTYDDYLISYVSTNRSDYQSFTSYGALIKGVAVCDGIASAFKLLCNIEGIECIEVSGTASDGGHAWNKVNVGGVWFGVDATWSRTNLSGKGIFAWHKYFLIDEVSLIKEGSGHYEQGEIDGSYITGFNIINTANNNLNYYEMMYYGKYDLVCNSKSEFTSMCNTFLENNVYYVEVYLDGVSYNQISGSLIMYSIFYSDTDPNRIYLVKK